MAKRLTKKEAAAQAERQEQARIRAALHWTEEAPPKDVPPPTGNGLSTGFAFNVYGRRVDVACSSAVFHAVGRTDQTTTQGSRALYSTRLLALQALRNALEWEFAKELDKIDRQIEAEQISPTGALP